MDARRFLDLAAEDNDEFVTLDDVDRVDTDSEEEEEEEDVEDEEATAERPSKRRKIDHRTRPSVGRQMLEALIHRIENPPPPPEPTQEVIKSRDWDPSDILSEQNLYAATIPDVPLWRVRTHRRCEASVQRYIEASTTEFQIESIFTRQQIPSWVYFATPQNPMARLAPLRVYLERCGGVARHLDDVTYAGSTVANQASEDAEVGSLRRVVRMGGSSRIERIAPDDWPLLDEPTQLPIQSWVSILKGSYRGDIGYVGAVTPELVNLCVIPRIPPPLTGPIPYVDKGRQTPAQRRGKKPRPVPVLFNPTRPGVSYRPPPLPYYLPDPEVGARERGLPVVQLQLHPSDPYQDVDGKEVVWWFRGHCFRYGGLMELVLKRSSVSCMDVHVSIAVADAFRLSALNEMRHGCLDGIPYPSEWPFDVGEKVSEVGNSSNRGTICEVVAIPPGMRRGVRVRLEDDTEIKGPIPLSSRTLQKCFNVGDYVACATPPLEGWVVSVAEKGAEVEVVQVSNTNARGIEFHNIEWERMAKCITVNRNSLRLATPRFVMDTALEPLQLQALKRDEVPWIGLEVYVTGQHAWKGDVVRVKDVTLSGPEGITLHVQKWGMAQTPELPIRYSQVKEAKFKQPLNVTHPLNAKQRAFLVDVVRKTAGSSISAPPTTPTIPPAVLSAPSATLTASMAGATWTSTGGVALATLPTTPTILPIVPSTPSAAPVLTSSHGSVTPAWDPSSRTPGHAATAWDPSSRTPSHAPPATPLWGPTTSTDSGLPPPPSPSQPDELFTPALIGKVITVIGKNRNAKNKHIPVIPRVTDGERFLERPGFRGGVQRVDYQVSVCRPNVKDYGLWLVAEGEHSGKFVRGIKLRRPRGQEEFWNVAIVIPRAGAVDTLDGEANIRAEYMVLAHEEDEVKALNMELANRLRQSPDPKPKSRFRK